MYILLTETDTYFVEYLLGQLVFSTNVSEAKVFDDKTLAFKFRDLLLKKKIVCSVNTFI